jgi:hypothetical protein
MNTLDNKKSFLFFKSNEETGGSIKINTAYQARLELGEKRVEKIF